MSVSITTPDSDAQVKEIMANKVICALGEASRNGQGAVEIRAKVWNQQLALADIPAAPPADAATGTMSGLNFIFSSILGAASSSSSPFPTNTLAVWGKFPTTPMPTWDRDSKYFEGKTASATDCGT